MFEVFDNCYDKVIKSHYLTASINYKDAIAGLYPAIDRLEIQRDKQNQKFYSRLYDDIKIGCVMPPITIALIDENVSLDEELSVEGLRKYVNDKLDEFFVLDGIQRLNTLNRVKQDMGEEFSKIDNRKLYVNIIICSTYDLLLYRMITLNNGQKPMSARHQIEVIAGNIFDFDEVDLPVQAEKREAGKRRRHGVFRKSDIIKGYLAFLSSSVNIDNNKIIESKMDEIIARKVVGSGITEVKYSFYDVVDLVSRFSEEVPELKKWFQNENNFVGFCSGIRDSFDVVSVTSGIELLDRVRVFDQAFDNLQVSRIKVGYARRLCAELFFSKFNDNRDLDDLDFTHEFSSVI
ncbi:hypothetical protein [Halomonas sp. KHS3]|uniref:hypothetical protein n=1 Tax=Halomonas sp. KHS3 TaxID=866350 RepID=UPI00059AF732|nr:hypothetical protein [Halomonas sp. KHS3]KIN13892.1 hypothetical protein RO22_17835 [Halomonas sp. KHS3]